MRTIEENKRLCERMPYLIPRNYYTDKIPEDYDYSYILGDSELPSGWSKLFLNMCEDIRQPLIDVGRLDKFKFEQVKEKYNTLRAYNNGAPKEVQDIIDKYEYISQFVCQKCGRPATKETQGWVASFCDECYPDDDILESIKFEPIIHIFGYKNGERYERTLDCSDEWRRLYGQK